VDFETALQFFEDEGLLCADQRQFDIRKRLNVLADFRVDACPMFSFDFRLPTHSELEGPFEQPYRDLEFRTTSVRTNLLKASSSKARTDPHPTL
jgi:hypothetical protein